MKLKNILIPFAGVLLLTACEKDHCDDNLTDPRVYIVNNGVQNAIYYDVEETIDFDIYAYSSGYFGQPSEVRIVPAPDAVEAFNVANGSSYTPLGEEYYQIVKATGSITAEGRRTTLTVRLDCKGIMALPYMNDYVLPLRLTATGTEVNEKLNTILINPRMQETEVLAQDSGVMESDLSATEAHTLEFTTYTEFDNKWDSEMEYEHGDAVLTAYNAEHGTQYIPLPESAYTFTGANLKAGSNKAVSTISIDKSNLTTDRYYTLAVKLKGNSKFKIGDRNTVLYHISLLPIYDNRSKWQLISCSSYQNGGEPRCMIDNDPSTRWENRYDSNGVGDQGKLPVITSWDMGDTFYWCGVRIGRRSDAYVTDLKSGYIELSDDGKTWTKVQDFDFGDKSNTSTSLSIAQEQWKHKGRYIRLNAAQSNRGMIVSITEFKPILAKIPE
ncbi:DUF1735 domain-containing protein [Alistipes sp.]|uniref:BT_3987 domain-containing protein n=1 Tax=Alistipes sp. TaxID=1872444 RepID=UPI0025C692C3|nr:DUF1735 domain-containing protein [Alistipes sp.]